MQSVPSDRSRRALLAIYDNAILAHGFVGDMKPEAFAEDRRTFYAACRCLEIISEAARRLDPEVRNRLSTIPWKDVIAAGNIYRHEYERVAEDRVWRTVVESLPGLIAVIRDEVRPM
jgi:uncharacterized protein with HEPN domain